METGVIKRCPSCETGKSIDSFHRNRSTPGGRQRYCKECRKATYSLFIQDPEHASRRRAQRRAGVSRWRHIRRGRWLWKNGPCQRCGSWTDLEVDHIDPATKVSHAVWSWSKPRRMRELAKCQVLCRTCHQEKSTGALRVFSPCGSRQSYNKGCHCSLCRAAQSEYHRRRRAG